MEKEVKETTEVKVEKTEAVQPVAPKYNTAVFVMAIIVSVLLGASIMAVCGPLFMRGHYDTFQHRSGLVVIDQQYGPQMMMRRLF